MRRDRSSKFSAGAYPRFVNKHFILDRLDEFVGVEQFELLTNLGS
jgi:hypothetical protein